MVWPSTKKALDVAMDSIYRYVRRSLSSRIFYVLFSSERMRQLLNSKRNTHHHCMEVSFSIFMEILNFYQSYRVIEQTLKVLHPAEEKMDARLGTSFQKEVRLHLL